VLKTKKVMKGNANMQPFKTLIAAKASIITTQEARERK